MRILFPIGSFYPAQSGGPNNTIYWLAEALAQNNLNIYVVTTDLDIQESHNIELNKWKLSRCGYVIYCKTNIHYLPFKLIKESIRTIKNIDVIHLNSIFYPPSLLIYLVNKFFYKKTVVWSTRGEIAKEAMIYGSTFKSTYLKAIRLLIRSNLYFHTTSKEESRLVTKQLKTNKIIEIPNYIRPNPKLDQNHVKDFYLLYIGRISPKKAIENLIHALSLSEFFKTSGIKLIIAGDYRNKYGDKLKKISTDLELGDLVEFFGHVENIEKDKLYANAYFTIVPSHNENFGNVVVESLSQGTPVIASTGTPWQILNKSHSGYWISNSPEKIARKIDEVLKLSKEEYVTLRRNSFRLVESEFDIKYKVGNWIDVYKNIAKVNE